MWWSVAAIALAQGPEGPPTGHDVVVDGRLVEHLAEKPRGVAVLGEHAYVLTAGGALQTWVRAGDGWAMSVAVDAPRAVNVFTADDGVWVVIRETRAVPVESVAMAPPVIAVAPVPAPVATVPATAPAADEGTHVQRTAPGVAVVDRGRKHGLGPGAEVRILGTESVVVPSLDGDGTETREVETVAAVGRVRVLEDERALVDLARGGRVDVGDRVEMVPGVNKYPAAPERMGGQGEYGIVVRPLLALDTVGVAFVNEAWIAWHFEQPWYASARLAPLGAGWSREGNPLSIAALASGGYDSRWFSVGLGAGWSMLNSDPADDYGYARAESDSIGVEDVDFEDVDSAFSLVQEARLGSEDGIHFTVRNTFLLEPVRTYTWKDECSDESYTGDYSDCYDVSKETQFTYGGIATRTAVPVGDRTDIFFEQAIGRAGALWVTGGVASWLRGNGGRGSFGAEVAAGYGALQGDPDGEYVFLGGPLVSAGARWRW